jgi:hypothetical protein
MIIVIEQELISRSVKDDHIEEIKDREQRCYVFFPKVRMLIICSLILMALSVSFASATWSSGWESEKNLVRIGTDDRWSIQSYAYPHIAYNLRGDGKWVLISNRQLNAVWHGYYYNPSEGKWVEDSSLVDGLVVNSWCEHPAFAYNVTGDGNWTMITHSHTAFNGYYWSGSEWIPDSARVEGLPDVGLRTSHTLMHNFRGDGTWSLITGSYGGEYYSFYWNGTGWSNDSSTYAKGLPDYGAGGSSRITTAKNISGDNKWDAILSKWQGTSFDVYTWNGTAWNENTTKAAGLSTSLTQLGYLVPTSGYNVTGDNKWILISGVGQSYTLLGFFYNTVNISSIALQTDITSYYPLATTVRINFSYPHTWNHRVKYSTNSNMSNALWSDWLEDMDKVDLKLIRLSPNTTYYYEVYTYLPWNISYYVKSPVKSFTTLPAQNPVTVNLGESIQDAIEMLPLEGGKVELAAGVHDVSDTIVINMDNITVQGTPDSEIRSCNPEKDVFVIPHENPSPEEDWDNMPSLKNFLFKGFTVTSSYGYQFNQNALIRAWKVTNLTIEAVHDTSYMICLSSFSMSGTPTKARNEDIYIRNNSMEHSGIAIADSDNVFILNNTVQDAKSNWAIYASHGLNHTHIIGNRVINAGSNAGMIIDPGQNWEIRDNYFQGGNGGMELAQVPVDAIIENNTITGARSYGILIRPQFGGENVTIRNNKIYNNFIGIWATQYQGATGIFKVNVINNVIDRNTDDGIRITSEHVGLNISNNIITNNRGYGINHLVGEISHSYNDVWGNTLGSYNNTTAGTGDINADPLFVDATNNNFHLKSTGGHWNGTTWVCDDESSPCIDAGDPASDYSNEPVPNGRRINMGAYGNTVEASKSPPPTIVSIDDCSNEKNEYLPGDNVSVKGSGLSSSTTYKIWIQPDPVGEGDTLDTNKDPSGLQETVTTDGDGNFSVTLIWAIPLDELIINTTFDKYDIVIDKMGLGEVIYSAADDGLDTINLKNTTPPASITNLQNLTGEKWINWTWTNPPDSDFNHTMIYLDGMWKMNASEPFYNATGLTSNTSYEIGTRTVDQVGNINATWVNQTTTTLPDTTPPVITHVIATSITMNSATLSWDTDELSDSMVKYGTVPKSYGLTAYNATNVTTHSIILTGLSPSAIYYYVVNSTDQSGNSNESAEHYFTTESAPTAPPIISGGGGGGGGRVLLAPPNVPIDPVTGVVRSTTTLTVNGATLTIPAGTIVKDANGNPLSTPITMWYIAESVGAIAAYDFGPSGVTFVQPIDLVIAYDSVDIPEGFSESDLVIRMWDGSAWDDLGTNVDEGINKATTKVSHFTTFALFAVPPVRPPPLMPKPVVTPTPWVSVISTSTPLRFPEVPLLVVIIMVVNVLVGAEAYFFLRRK